MHKRTRKSDVSAGEAGYRGPDRQPVGEQAEESQDGTLDKTQAASPREVRSRSRQARALKRREHARPDMIHPGPEREEGEKSKGDAHHDQHEKEKEMRPEAL